MASLTITIGTLSASVNADNARAQNILSDYAAAIGAEGTNQQKLQAVVQALATHLREVAQRQHSTAAQVALYAQLEGELGSIAWT